MAKPSSKPAKKGQAKSKPVAASKTKPAKKAPVKVVKAVKVAAAKPVKKAVVAKAKPVRKPTTAKPLKAKAKVVAKAAKTTSAKPKSKVVAKAKPIAKPVVKQAKPAHTKKVGAAKSKVVVKPLKVKPIKVKAVKGASNIKVAAKAATGKQAAIKPIRTQAVAGVAPKVQKGAKANKVSTAAQTLVAESVSNQKKVVHTSSKALARTLAQLPPPPPPPPMLPEPQRRVVSPAALKAFEQAVKLFNRQHYADAKKHFESLEEKFPLDGEVIGRAQIYLQACEKKLIAAAPVRPISADDLYDQGVHALNNGDYPQARQYFEKALKLNPNEPDFLYSLAAVCAQTGGHDEALDLLARSIQIKPRFRSQAFEDSDFSSLRSNRQFMELLGLTSPFERLDQRR